VPILSAHFRFALGASSERRVPFPAPPGGRERTLLDEVKMPTALGINMAVFIFTTSVTADTAILICVARTTQDPGNSTGVFLYAHDVI